MMKRAINRALSLLFLAGFITTTAQAQDVVIQPINSTLEPNGDSYIDFHPRWIDGSGLEDASIVESGDPVPATWPEHIAGYHNQRIERIRNADEFETLTFELGGIYELTGMVLWNSTELNKTARGFEHTALSYSTDGGATFVSGETLTWLQREAEESATQTAEPYTYYTPEVQSLTTSVPGVTHVRMVVDNFASESITMAQEIRFTGVPAPQAYYISATRTDWTDAAAWSDGSPAMAGTQYYATNSVVLETPATTATFPGEFLTMGVTQRMDVMVTGSDVITIDPLNLNGGDLAAGVVDAGEAKIDGAINVIAGSSILGTTNGTPRDFRILSEISSAGAKSLELSAPEKTIYIDNANNTFDGVWIVAGGTAEFTSAGAVGTARINVQSNATLRILGNWDGLTTGESLTVADGPGTTVDLGANDWTVLSLNIGTSNVLTGFTYDVSELNAVGSNAVFTGTGTIQIGEPYQPPPPPDTYYLQANIAAGQWIGQKERWFDAPTGGNPMPLHQIFAGSTFDVNGFGWRTENTAETSVFEGLLVQGENAVDKDEILIAHYAGDQRLEGGMILTNSTCTLRPHRSPAGIHISDLFIGADADLQFRTLIFQANTTAVQNASFEAVTGSGVIEFGGANSYDEIGIWSLGVTDSPDFQGTFSLVQGELTFANDMVLPNAAFVLDSSEDNSVVLTHDVSFGKAAVGTVLAAGTYTADELNSYLSSDRFSGDGTLTVSAGATEFYLHENGGQATTTNKTAWFTDPLSGSQMGDDDTFDGNRFNMNGFEMGSLNTPNSDNFGGAVVVSNSQPTTLKMYAAMFNMSGMFVDDFILVRQHRGGTTTLSPGHLEIGAAGEVAFRSLTANVSQDLIVDNIVGSGTITFGQTGYAIDDGATWGLAVNDTTPMFTGSVKLERGELTFDNAFVLDSASFDVETDAAGVVLSNSVSFNEMSFGAASLTELGTYSASQLNTQFSTTIFSGPGTLSIVEESYIDPESFAYWAVENGLTEGVNDGYEDDAENGGIGDGMNNLLEYALGGNPLVDDAAIYMPVQDMSGSYMYYIYNRRTDADNRGLSYDVSSSVDLVFDSLTNATEFVGSTEIGGGFETATNRVPTADEQIQFMGLKVELSE